jgi:hypothetical protein
MDLPTDSFYRDDIVFRDPRNTFEGLKNYKLIFWSLRFHGRLFFSKLYVEVKRIWQVGGDYLDFVALLVRTRLPYFRSSCNPCVPAHHVLRLLLVAAAHAAVPAHPDHHDRLTPTETPSPFFCMLPSLHCPLPGRPLSVPSPVSVC